MKTNLIWAGRMMKSVYFKVGKEFSPKKETGMAV